jgi:uncharacterized protein (DUF488 family)
MPHFSRASLQIELPVHGVEYLHMPELGGLRKPGADSVNSAWRNDSFRGYADYMLTDEFWRAIDRVRDLAASARTAIMCAEAVPWRCHRSLIADALTVEGVEVRHITGKGDPSPHRVTSFAVVANGRITYPGTDTLPL